MPEISVIIPSYNAGEKLLRCMKSLQAQSFGDFECIVIDDGSTDGSALKAAKEFQYDSRFIIHRQDNGGVSAARNCGLAKASGRFITFIDSDDYVELHHLARLISRMADCELAVCGYIYDRSDSTSGSAVTSLYDGKFTFAAENNAVIADLLRKNAFFGPTCKLYRADTIRRNGISFPKGISSGEDLMFNFQYLRYCESIAICPEASYHYVHQEGSLSSQRPDNYWELNIGQWRIMDSLFNSRGLDSGEVKSYLYERLIGIVYDSLFIAAESGATLRDKYARCKKYLKQPDGIDLTAYHSALASLGCSGWIRFCIKHRLPLLFTILSSR